MLVEGHWSFLVFLVFVFPCSILCLLDFHSMKHFVLAPSLLLLCYILFSSDLSLTSLQAAKGRHLMVQFLTGPIILVFFIPSDQLFHKLSSQQFLCIIIYSLQPLLFVIFFLKFCCFSIKHFRIKFIAKPFYDNKYSL